MNDINVRKHFAKILKQAGSHVASAGPEGLQLLGIAVLLQKQPLDMMKLVGEFHQKFKQTYDGPPRVLPPELYWRMDFCDEELEEYRKAVEDGDIEKQYDALMDLLYVILGTIYTQRLPLYEGFLEVHKSNMSKELVEVGKGKFGLTVHKGKDYKKPNLKQFLPLPLP